MPRKAGDQNPRHLPEDLHLLAPVLPLLYVAWSDGSLSEQDQAGVAALVAQAGVLDARARDALLRWADPADPPNAVELGRVKSYVREASEEWRGETLVGLGLHLADQVHVLGWDEAPVRAALAQAEAALGLHSSEAVRRVLSGVTRPGDLARPRAAGFDVPSLSRYLNPDYREVRQSLLALMQDERFQNPPDLPSDVYRERILVQLRELADRGLGRLAYPTEFGGGGEPGASLVAFETLAYGDLSLLVKFGVQFGLFGGSILNLGTGDHHRRFLADVGTLRLAGCYAMSESRHGSNVREVETTATYDPRAEEFVVHSPHPLSRKDWIGNAARHGRLATVFAQLRTAGESFGVHAFLVPIRDSDGKTLPGITIEDCGHKVGLNGVDNGRIAFEHVCIPRENLLNRFGDVNAAGEYTSPIPSEGKRFFTMLGTLVAGRVSIAAASLSASKTGLSIAIRYAERRRQFGPAHAPEVPLLDYLAHQRALLPRLATTYGLHFAVQALRRTYVDRDPEDVRELEVTAAGLKAFASRHNVETLQACREACGGKGYLSENRFGSLKADTDVFTTFEGSNAVLLQLVAKGLLTRYRHEMADLNLWGIVRHVAERAGTRAVTYNPVARRRTEGEHLRDPELHLNLFGFREERLLQTAAARLKGRLDEGVEPFAAMNQVQDHLLTLAEAHVEHLILEHFLTGVAEAPLPGLSEVLRTVAELYALSTIERHRGWYLESGALEPSKSKAIRGVVNQLCAEVREQAQFLVNGFEIPDGLLAAPAAFVDERPEAER